MEKKNIVAFSGSLREQSMNTGLLRAVQSFEEYHLRISILDIHTLPLYNQDLEAAFPPEAQNLKNYIRSADGILIATPEYNHSIPGVLKNMLDWTSRPYGDVPWEGKAVGVIGAAAGSSGGILAQYDLKKILLYFNARVMGQPEFAIGNAFDKFDEAGNLIDPESKKYLGKFLERFSRYL